MQRSTNLGASWTTITTIQSPLNAPNTHQTRTYTDPSTFNPTTTTRYYRVLANNTVGYVADTAYPQMTATSNSNTRVVGPSFNIIASAGAGGTISPIGTVTVGRGGSQTFTITPNANFRRATVLIDGVNNATAVSTGTYTFTNVQAPHTISVTFAQSAATITSSAGTGGTISPNGTQTVAIGGSQTYTITPNPGYHVADVLVDGINHLRRGDVRHLHVHQRGGEPHDRGDVHGHRVHHHTQCRTERQHHAEHVADRGERRERPAFTITPNAGYHILQVLVDGVYNPAAVTSGTYTFTNVTANHTIGATFEANPPST